MIVRTTPSASGASGRLTALAALVGAMGLGAGTSGAEPPGLLETFIGRWHGEGTLFGERGPFRMTWERALGGAFVRLVFANPAIEAEALYHAETEGRYVGTWADSRGIILPLAAVASDSVLVASWGSEETERGETHYRLVDPGTIEVVDYVLREGKPSPFARARYRREAPSP